ncbi:MAG: ABC transporter permease subunit [Eubacteriaceae bacterium]
MISLTLFRKTMKSNYKLILIFMVVLTLYFSIIANMYDPKNLDLLDTLASMKLSPELLNAMGFTLTDTSLVGFLSSYFYGLLMLAFPMICTIILGNKLVAGLVDKGSMAYLLASPNSRRKIVTTQAIFLLTVITLLVGFVTLLGVIFCQIKFSGLLDVKAFLLLNLGVLLLHYAIGGICFFASCLFSDTKNSLALGAGLPILFLLIQMLSNANKDLEFLRYFTIFSLFNPKDIIHGDNILLYFGILVGIALVLYGVGVLIFNKKDLMI